MTSLGALPVATAADVCCPGADCDLLPVQEASDLADVFRALGDPNRVRLLRYLAQSDGGTACACHLPEALGITQPTLSFHLRKLHDAGPVSYTHLDVYKRQVDVLVTDRGLDPETHQSLVDHGIEVVLA